jgi:hypothetical protein
MAKVATHRGAVVTERTLVQTPSFTLELDAA